ncbi:MAG: peptidoglycan DD-metalloendopeptidase family protein [Candidatus Glassbacteria bacterium]
MKAIRRVWYTILLLIVSYLLILASVPFLMRMEDGELMEPEPSQSEVEMVIVDTLGAGDTLDGLFRRRGFTYAELLEIMRASHEHYDLNRLDAGTILSLAVGEDGAIRTFKCGIDERKILILERQGEGYTASVEEILYETRTRTVKGVIQSSLYETLLEAREDPIICLALSEVFAWQIDFNTDLRNGDSYYAIVEERLYDGKPPVFSKVIAARMVNQGRTITAIRFEDPEGHVDYYDPGGKSLKRKFLRSPLRYRRVSSSYSKRRYHPILKIYRPHLGVDYAAPTGTPVVSVGDGIVTYAGSNGGFGKFVRIRHNSIYASTYGHLSRFARGIRKGTVVKQGQVIGYVGASGLATGPHLDYRLTKNNRFVNPLKVDLPSAEPVKEKYMGQFKDLVASLSQRLENPEAGVELTREKEKSKNDDG